MGHWDAQVVGLEQVGTLVFVHVACPPLNAVSRLGQFVLVRPLPRWDPYLRSVMFLVAHPSQETWWLYAQDLAQSTFRELWQHTAVCSLWGPWGSGFPALSPGGRVLVMTAERYAAYVLGAVHEWARGMDVVFLLLREGGLLPEAPTWLPPSVEFIPVARNGAEFWAAAQRLLAWTDYVFMCGPSSWPSEVARMWEETRSALTPGRVFALLVDGITCGLGVCDTCVWDTPRGTVRLCRRGPVVDLAHWWGAIKGR